MNTITNEIIRKFELYLYEEERNGNTIEKYMRDIRAFREWLQGRNIDKSVVIEYKKRLCERYAIKSVNSMLSSINAFFVFMGWYDLKVKTLKIQRRIFADKSKELSKAEYINDIPYTMDVAPVIIDNRTLAPARYVAEAFGYYVNWDEMTKSVLISKDSNFNISQIKDGTREHPYKFGDKVSITFWDPFDFNATAAVGTYEFTLKSLMSPEEMEKKFNDTSYGYDKERWYLNGYVTLSSYNKEDVCSFSDMMHSSNIVTSDLVPGEYYSWYINPSNYRFVKLYKGGSTECYIPVQTNEIAEGQTADYFTITYYSNKDTQNTIWFAIK